MNATRAGATEPIAIVGIGCRLPGGVTSHASLWQLLEDGVDAIGPVPPGRWDVDRYYSPKAQQPGRMNAREGGFLDRVDAFDAAFFGISARIAEQMDPQQRLLLEVCWETLEDAGIVPDNLAGGRTGVFVGACSQDYGGLQTAPGEVEGLGPHSATGTFASILSNRLSYTFDLRGPSMTIDTACSSSLVAVHLACQSLERGESDLALAGGVNLMLTPQFAIALSQAAMLSPDARSRAFDAAANGYVRGEGAGVVVLKPLARAQRDQDRIYAVIRGTAVNQDGRTQGITVPNGDAQQTNFLEALAVAGVAPQDIGYIEAHGTGTPVGDPIEARALGEVAVTGRDPEHVALMGSIKTNIGHLEASAGVAGLIKAALSVYHRRIPASLHFEAANPEIDFEGWSLDVPTSARPWPEHYDRALAAVNSFGFGGTNANVVLEEPPEPGATDGAAPEPVGHPSVLTLSARSEPALRQLAAAHAERLEDEPVDLERLAAALALRRAHHGHRLTVTATESGDAAASLRAYADGATPPGARAGTARRGAGKVAFLFNGQGPQWHAMGRTLLETSPTFRAKVMECDELARPHIDWSIYEALTAPDEASSRVHETQVLQPTMFAIQVALAELWREWGVEPAGVCGHSMGEIAAAHVAGGLDLATALKVICHRSRIQETADDTGRMMFVALGSDEARALCDERPGELWLSAENSTRASTLSGRLDALEALAAELEERGVFARILRVNCACHSPDMDPLHDELLSALDGVAGTEMTIPMYSTATGELIEGEALVTSYWWQNFREPVLFAPAVRAMLEDGFDTFIELSPHPVLANSLKEIFDETHSDALPLASLVRKEDDWKSFLGAFAQLYVAGGDVDWRRRYPAGAAALALPPNPWAHEDSFWNEGQASRLYRSGGQEHPMLKRIDAARPTWEIRWDDHRLAWVKEHDVFGSVIVPGAAYVEAALAAARELTGEPCALEFVEFERACVLGDEAQLSRVELDPDEGTFVFHHRPVRGDAWVRSVRGRFHRAPAADVAPRTLDLDAIRERCPAAHDAIDVYGLLRRKGYAYGPAFCGIDQLHVGDGEALARVTVPRVLSRRLAGYSFHPAVLDACFQSAILHPSPDRPDELLPFTYLPTGIERARVYGDVELPVWCYTRARRHDASGLCVEIYVLGEHGELIAEYSPLHGKVVPQSDADAGERIDEHFYRLTWKADREARASREPRPSALTVGPAGLRDELETASRTLAERLDRHAYATAYQDDVRQLCSAYVARSLRRLGCDLNVGQKLSLDDVAGVLPAYKRALARFMRFLVEDGVLAERDGSFTVERAPDADPDALWGPTLARHPECVSELMLLRRTGTDLDAVLTGRADPLELLFPGGSLDETEPIYQSSPVARLCNMLVKQAVDRLARTADRRRTLRVLEVGGGTGGLTTHVLGALPADRTEYVFTDVSAAFAQAASEQFRAFPFVEYRTLDLESDLLDQGIDAGSFDLVLGADVVHATTDLKGTVLRLQEALAPGGILALIEADPDNRWLDLTFGLTDGWWAFRDLQLRPGGPLMTAPDWERLLRSTGYDDVIAVGDPGHQGAGSQSVLLARATVPASSPLDDRLRVPLDGEPERLGDWLIVGEPDALSEGLAHRIGERGGRAVLVPAGDVEEYDRLLASLEPEGVVHLCNGPDQGAPAATGLAHCRSITDLLRALDRKQPGEWPRVYVLTRGAHAFRNGTVHIEGAPAWGLGLVAGLELPQAHLKLIDLDTGVPSGELDDLWAELWSADHEGEVALRAGERFTRRLVALTPDELSAPVDARDLPADTRYVLEMESPGSLDGLRYRAAPRLAPAPGQVELEVVAGGLNFLDVMTALGQVPLLESAHGYRFGAECAGVVTRVAEDVTELRVGDAVVAVSSAQGALASHITLDAGCVVPKPAGLGFEEAATVPIVFLTAWYALERLARLQPGERVLIHSAAGGTGLAAVQIAQRAGAEVLATAGTPEKRALLRSLGVSHVMDSRSLAFAEEVERATGGAGVDVVLNAIAGEAVDRSIACLAPYGRFVEIGKRDLLGDRRLGLRPFLANLAYFSFDLRQTLVDRPREVRGALEHVLELIARGELRPLPSRAFQPSQAETAFRHMAAAKHVGKLVVAMDEREVRVVPAPEPPLTASGGTWLITGGLGGVGLSMADALAGAGIRHLVLIGRSGVRDDATRARVEALRERGVEVLAEAVDVTSRPALEALFTRIERELPPLRGVLHCAMLLDDVLLTDMDEAHLERVLAPKAVGAWNLHELTADLDLDAFVLFSSATSMVGNIGQANYAAANAFLDHLAEARRARGQRALAVNWGAVSDAGYVARHEDVARMVEATGMRGFTVAQAFQALEALVHGGIPQVGVLPMDWPQFLRHHALDPSVQPRYADLLAARTDDAGPNGHGPNGGSLRQQLRSNGNGELDGLLRSALKERVATVLGIAFDDLDEDMPLMDYLDSLLAVEISSWIEREVGAKVTIMELMKGPSIAELGAQLLAQLGERQPTAVAG